MEEQEFEQDETLQEARKLKRLELKRKRKLQQRIVIGVLAVILVLAVVLVIRGCSNQTTVPPAQTVQTEQPAPETDPGVQTEPDTVVTLAAVGDIMAYADQISDAEQADGSYDFASCFSAISAYTMAADLTVGNLELNFCGAPYSGYPDFKAPESLADTLKAIGFDVLQTANTYSIQNGISGLGSTLKYLTTTGIDHVGSYATEADKTTNEGVLLKTVNGVKIAFIAYTKGLNGLSLPSGSEYAVNVLYSDYSTDFSQINQSGILDSIDAAKALEPDVIVAMLHWGSEYETAVSDTQTQITDLMLQNGVDVILGSHSHIVGPMEEKTVTVDGKEKNCFVAYSLGNFVSSKEQTGTLESVILNLEFTKNGGTGETTISNVSYIPLYIMNNGTEAENQFEVLPIRSAISSNLFPDKAETLTDAIANLRIHTASDYDSGK